MRLLAGILWGNMLSMRSRTEPAAVEPHAPGSLAPLQRRSLLKTGATGLCARATLPRRLPRRQRVMPQRQPAASRQQVPLASHRTYVYNASRLNFWNSANC